MQTKMQTGMQTGIDAVIDAALGARIVGCVVLVSRHGQMLYARAAGLADREAGRAMARDTVFRLASVTKPIVAVATLRMVDQGMLRLDDPVQRYLPDFRPLAPDGSRPDISIHHLLTHTSGLTYGGDGDHSRGLAGPLISLDENMARLARQALLFTPGSGWEYGMSIDVLAAALAVIDGPMVADVLKRQVTGHLAMVDTAFGVDDPMRLAVPYCDGRPPMRMGEPELVVGDDGSVTPFSPERILQPTAPQSGGAGMAGTADDVMRLLQAVQGDFLAPETRALALGNRIGEIARRPGDAGKRFGYLGAVTVDAGAAKTVMPVGSVDWGGAWGHNWVLDPASGTCIVTMTNTAFEGCNGPFREEINRAVFGG